MKKATKVTLKRLETEDFGARTCAATLLEHIVKSANRYEKTGDYNSLFRASYHPDCLYYLASDEREKRILRGLASWNEKLIECTLTHGLNECRILDINKLVKRMLSPA